MDDSLGFAISRERTEWDDLVYECRECNVTGGAVGALDHVDDCRVSNLGSRAGYQTESPGEPEYEHDAVSPPTWEVIRDLERKSEFLMHEQSADTDEMVEAFREVNGVRWVATGSTHRVILGLGRTSPRGAFHRDDQRGVVVKIDPRIRFDEEYTPVSSNLDELYKWEKAVETETTRFFADMLAVAADGMWLAMEYCIPISLRVRSEMNSRDMLYDKGGEQYIHPLRGALKEAGWENPDYKHANIGLTDNGVPVLIDYGTGPDYVADDPVNQ